jgi:hypothetical protein
MGKRVGFAAGVAVVLTVAVLLCLRFLGSEQGTTAGEMGVSFDVDPDISGNTASSIGPGGIEDCLRVDVAPGSFGDGVADVTIDVVVQGDTLAPVAYDAWLIYEPTKVDPVTWDDRIKLPGAAPMTVKSPPQLNAGVLYMSGGPGTPGDGTLVRINLDVISAGVASFSLDYGAYRSAAGIHPSSTGTGLLAINEDCPRGGQGAEGGAVREDESSEGAEAQQVRWGNVTVTVPSDSDLHYGRLGSAPQAVAQGIMGPMLLLGMDESLLIIDAQTGRVVYDDVLPAERAAFDAVLATVEVVEAEVATDPGAPWPYGSTPPDTPRQGYGARSGLGPAISYLPPDPRAGINAGIMEVDAAGPGPPWSGPWIIVVNGRSKMWVTWYGVVVISGGGELTLDEFAEADPSLLTGIHPDDREAFQRFARAIEIRPWPTPTAAPEQQAP